MIIAQEIPLCLAPFTFFLPFAPPPSLLSLLLLLLLPLSRVRDLVISRIDRVEPVRRAKPFFFVPPEFVNGRVCAHVHSTSTRAHTNAHAPHTKTGKMRVRWDKPRAVCGPWREAHEGTRTHTHSLLRSLTFLSHAHMCVHTHKCVQRLLTPAQNACLYICINISSFLYLCISFKSPCISFSCIYPKSASVS